MGQEMTKKNVQDPQLKNDSVWSEDQNSVPHTAQEEPKKSRFLEKVSDAVLMTRDTIAVVAGHKSTKVAIEWSKQLGTELGHQATDLGNDVLNSDLGKAATKGAAIGAVAAIPIPIIGPIAGAIVGAGIGGYLNIKHGVGTMPKEAADDQNAANGKQPQATEDVIADLKKLDDLRQAGILSDGEFQEQKSKLLKRI